MLNYPTLEKLRALQLTGMANALEEQLNKPLPDLDFESRLAMLVEQEWIVRENRRLDRASATLGSVFAVWGQPLGRRAWPASAAGAVRERHAPHATRGGCVLHDGDEIVLEVGGYGSAARSFTFPPFG